MSNYKSLTKTALKEIGAKRNIPLSMSLLKQDMIDILEASDAKKEPVKTSSKRMNGEY